MTNKPLTPQEIIDRLANFEVIMEHPNGTKSLKDNPVYIGDVLAKFFDNKPSNLEKEKELLFYWGECGSDKSLQEIEKESGSDCCFLHFDTTCDGKTKKLKSPQARDLFNFLSEIL
jgi:hypothetical protein